MDGELTVNIGNGANSVGLDGGSHQGLVVTS